MDFKQLEQLGDELRGIGHKRRQLVEQIFQEVKEGDQQSSKELYKELSSISDQAIGIIQHQKELFDQEVSRMQHGIPCCIFYFDVYGLQYFLFGIQYI